METENRPPKGEEECSSSGKLSGKKERVVLVIHGGAGGIRIPPEEEVGYRKILLEALQAGYDVLKSGGTSLEAVCASISHLEDDPHFNAGQGAALNNRGFAELDASIMDGKTLNAGAVAAVKKIKNPIQAAKKVLEKSPHLFLAGSGADIFAQEQRLPIVEKEYFITEKRKNQLERVRKRSRNKIVLDHGQSSGIIMSKDGYTSDYKVKPQLFVYEDDALPTRGSKVRSPGPLVSSPGSHVASPGSLVSSPGSRVDQIIKASDADDQKLGTVGAVALDIKGNLAAGTSTGGLVNQRYGRVADTPIIGSGVYANNKTCAVSSTGRGEYFIKLVLAYDISCMMEYCGMSLRDACRKAVKKKLTKIKGRGGVIALDKDGNMAYPYNTRAMYRGYVTEKGHFTVTIYKDEDEREELYTAELMDALENEENEPSDEDESEHEEEIRDSSEI